MKKFISMLILALVSTLALALPAPTDIEAAVRAGNLAQAETMLHEVIRAKPGSAKAHYELGQILARQGKNDDARRELVEAERIDPSLKFATDPLRFRNLVNHVSNAASPAAKRPADAARTPVPAVGAMSAGGFGTGTGYGPGSVPANSGSGIGGAVLGGVAGLAAGYGLAKMLEGQDSSAHSSSLNDRGYLPIDPVPTDFGAFDAGSGSDWDDSTLSGDVSSADDNW